MSREDAGAEAVRGWVWPEGAPPPEDAPPIMRRGVLIRTPNASLIQQRKVALRLRDAQPGALDLPVGERIAMLAAAAGAALRRARIDLDALARNAQLSERMVSHILDDLEQRWTEEKLARLVRSEFPDPGVLNGWRSDGAGRRVRVRPAPLLLIIGAGAVPGVTAAQILRGLLVGSAVWAKPGARDVKLTIALAKEIHRHAPPLSAALAAQYWPGGDPKWEPWEKGLLTEADAAVVLGSDAVIRAVRRRAPATLRLVEHANRMGAAVVCALDLQAATDAAKAVCALDQRGCVSTHLIVLVGASGACARWLERMNRALDHLDSRLPIGPLSEGGWSELHQLRGAGVVRAAAKEASLVSRGKSGASGGWATIASAAEGVFPIGGRTAWIVRAKNWEGATGVLSRFEGTLQTVGLSPALAADAKLDALARMGATRIVPLSQAPFPDMDWLHDGARPLGELVQWCESRLRV